MPEAKFSEDVFRTALARLADLLQAFPNHPALFEAAEGMDLPDELWLAVAVMRLPEDIRMALRDFLLVNPRPQAMRVKHHMLALMQGG